MPQALVPIDTPLLIIHKHIPRQSDIDKIVKKSIYGRIPVDYAPMEDLSIDIKTMPQAFGGYHLLLVITCDQTNFMIAVPLRDRTAQTVAEALIYSYIFIRTA